MGSPKGAPFWLKRLEGYMPRAIIRLEIGVCMLLTRSACPRGSLPPRVRQKIDPKGDPTGQRLRLYREFTQRAVENSSQEECAAFRRRLYVRALLLGRCLGALPGLRDMEAKKRLIILLYRNIEIQVKDGEEAAPQKDCWHLLIPRCSFSQDYTPKTCHVLSGFDAGIICGILGPGSLTFTHRITQGSPACMALYQRENALYRRENLEEEPPSP